MSNLNNIVLIRPLIKDMPFPMPNPPIGLGYLASVLERAGFHVFILDLNVTTITTSTLIQFIKRRRPVFVGISALTQYYPGLLEISKTIKSNIPDLPIVIGGVHPSSLPSECLEETDANFVVVGEGEVTVVELAEALLHGIKDFSNITGLVFKDGTRIVHTPRRALIDDLDSIPFPAWSKIKPSKYPPEPHGVIMKHTKVAPVLSTRGCPFDCSYCASCNFWGRRIRFRSPKNVVDEIQYLHETFGIQEIHFWDDNITLKRDHIIGICKEIIKRGLNKLAYNTPNGVKGDTLDEKLLKIMKMAGFYSLTFAVESGSQKILKQNGKNISLEKLMKNAEIAHKLGYHLSSFYILGFPEESESSIRATIEYAKKFPHGNKKFFILTPLPGSRIYEGLMQKLNRKAMDWSQFNFHDVTISASRDFTVEELKDWQKEAFRQSLLSIPAILTTLFIRFVKYGHIIQIPSIISRVRKLLL